MTERNRKILIFAILGVAIIWGAWNLIPRGGAGDAALLTGQSDVDPDQGVQAAAISAPRIYSADSLVWEQDPFARSVSVARSGKPVLHEASFHLAAVSAQAESAMAVINGAVVRVGDQLSGWEVATIESESVTLKQGERSRRITMKGQ